MAITQPMLDALVKAYMSGQTSGSHGDRSWSFRSMADMESNIATAARALGVANPLAPASTVTTVRQLRIYADGKGL